MRLFIVQFMLATPQATSSKSKTSSTPWWDPRWLWSSQSESLEEVPETVTLPTVSPISEEGAAGWLVRKDEPVQDGALAAAAVNAPSAPTTDTPGSSADHVGSNDPEATAPVSPTVHNGLVGKSYDSQAIQARGIEREAARTHADAQSATTPDAAGEVAATPGAGGSDAGGEIAREEEEGRVSDADAAGGAVAAAAPREEEPEAPRGPGQLKSDMGAALFVHALTGDLFTNPPPLPAASSWEDPAQAATSSGVELPDEIDSAVFRAAREQWEEGRALPFHHVNESNKTEHPEGWEEEHDDEEESVIAPEDEDPTKTIHQPPPPPQNVSNPPQPQNVSNPPPSPQNATEPPAAAAPIWPWIVGAIAILGAGTALVVLVYFKYMKEAIEEGHAAEKDPEAVAAEEQGNAAAKKAAVEEEAEDVAEKEAAAVEEA